MLAAEVEIHHEDDVSPQPRLSHVQAGDFASGICEYVPHVSTSKPLHDPAIHINAGNDLCMGLYDERVYVSSAGAFVSRGCLFTAIRMPRKGTTLLNHLGQSYLFVLLGGTEARFSRYKRVELDSLRTPTK